VVHAWPLESHVPAADPEPAPQDRLSQSAFLWQACPLVAHVPVVDPEPAPQRPAPQSASAWHTAPALHRPVWPAPPHVPRPQSAVVWHATAIGEQVPAPQVPSPQSAFDLQVTGEHVLVAQVPSQSESALHSQIPFTHAWPAGQSLFFEHVGCWHVPLALPTHANDPFGQSALAPQGSLHWPVPPPVDPWQVAEKPQSRSEMH